MKKKLLSSLIVAISVFAAGCTSSISDYQDIKKHGNELVKQAYEHAPKTPELAHIQYTDSYYVPELTVKNQDKPSWFFEPSEGSYSDYTLEEVMRDQLASRGVNIRYLDNLDKGRSFSLVHHGTVGELLEKISFATKYSYQINGDLLTWSKFKTQEFDVSFLAGSTEYLMGTKDGNTSSNNSNSGSGGLSSVVTDTGVSNSDEYINFTTKGLSVWDDLSKSIEMLKSEEGKFTINQATASVLVKDYPDNVAAIGKYLETGNNRLTTTVAVDFQIIKFTASEGTQHSLNWNVLKDKIISGGALSLDTAFSTLEQTDLASSVLKLTKTTGKWAGSSAFINLLDKYGVVTEEAKFPLVTLNNQVGKYVVGRNRGYLAQSGGTSTANVGTETTLIPGLLKTGDTLFVLPNVTGDKITVQVSTKQSKYNNLRTVESGNRSIETPEYDTNELFVKFSLRDGQTLLIGGNNTHRNDYTENSTGGTIALGGEYGGTESNSQTLMLITPRIMHY